MPADRPEDAGPVDVSVGAPGGLDAAYGSFHLTSNESAAFVEIAAAAGGGSCKSRCAVQLPSDAARAMLKEEQ